MCVCVCVHVVVVCMCVHVRGIEGGDYKYKHKAQKANKPKNCVLLLLSLI